MLLAAALDRPRRPFRIWGLSRAVLQTCGHRGEPLKDEEQRSEVTCTPNMDFKPGEICDWGHSAFSPSSEQASIRPLRSSPGRNFDLLSMSHSISHRTNVPKARESANRQPHGRDSDPGFRRSANPVTPGRVPLEKGKRPHDFRGTPARYEKGEATIGVESRQEQDRRRRKSSPGGRIAFLSDPEKLLQVLAINKPRGCRFARNRTSLRTFSKP